MDWFCPRCRTDQMSRSMTRAQLVVIFWTLILTMMLYPVLSMLAVQLYTALSSSYVAGHHSVLLINCPTEQTAKDIGRHIMEKRMAACVNILPRTSTMFYWKGEIQDASEILLLVRTRTSMIQQLTDFVNAIHPYQTPEILSFPIQDGSHSYLKWIDDAVPDV
ncbi:protein CutA homolog [Ictalurus furcatus]|uniref:protein CutA homolog n=1 Tax=Ictalurus furcatus TaxID=66913 RepID=UPI00234FB809|nr:protein CutA homolog [Ictalurus furcatus]